MKDKYDNKNLENINAKELFKDIKDELDTILYHIDLLKAIVDSDCIVLTLDDAFKKIDKVFDTVTVIGNSSLTELTNRFQKGDKDE